MANFYSFAALTLLWCIVDTNGQDCSGRPPMMKPANDCCKINSDSELDQCMQKVKEQWNAFHQSQNKDTFDMSSLCSSNCFTTTNVFTSDNKVNSEEVQSILEKVLGAEWQSMIPNMVATCKQEIDNFNPANRGPPPGNRGPPPQGNGQRGPPDNGQRGPPGGRGPMPNCNMTKEMLVHCVHGQILVNCPDSAWNNGEECNNIRNFIKNCPFEKRGGPREQ